MMYNQTNKLIPELRFPEFVNDGEWNDTSLNDLSKIITKGTTPTTLGFSYTDSGVNFIKIESILEGKLNLQKAAFITDECNEVLKRSQLKENDILLSIAGALGVVTTVTKDVLPANTNQALSIIRLKNVKQKDYIKGYLNSNQIASEINKIKAGAAQPNISLNQVQNFRILIPKNPTEQQKIADCLSSLDELIMAHSDKLKTLKTYKKGLMQNLFPQEGEKVPKIRFKEFEKDGVWVQKKLGTIAKNLDARRVPITSNQREKGNVPYYGASGIIDYVKNYIYDETLLCISEDGANLIDRNYPIAFCIYGKTWVNNHAHVLRFENFETQTIVENYINSVNIQDFLTGMAQPKLNRGKLDIILIPLPKNQLEQQKIASTLSSLDNLITAQTNKIDQLKSHKKGLMQGLFPKVKN